MAEPIISFKDFTFQYRAQKRPTLYDINLDIYPGERVLIVGPSGSGKSTLASCINGLIPHSYAGEHQGTLIVDGVDAPNSGIFELSQHVGTVLQDPDGQFVGLTVGEDIAFSLENNCVPQQEMIDLTNQVAGMVGVQNHLEYAPHELSGGQKQRVSLAGVMVNQVKILLFDEPLANLDPATGKRAIALIDEIQKKNNTTIIIIEHRLEDALYRNVDRIIVVGEGRIVADMKPDELLTTDILVKQGIREPLYIAALKHAGCEIRKDTHPSQIEELDVSPYKEKVREWFDKTTLPAKEKNAKELLKIENVSFSYDSKKQILKNINITVNEGEMLSIVGKNGAGKTTLSNLVCGFYHPVEGRILYEGEDMASLSIKERGERIGLVMQNPNQMISKPMIFDEVALGLVVRGVPQEEIKERVNETLKICGLYQMRNWPVSALSFGQKKRVTIASILVLNPKVMILDEPTAGQDYYHYTEIMEFLRKLNREQGITIIMITHDMHLMLEYTDRAVVIADGELLADDTPARVLTDEALADKAYLKKTSLYDLAVKCGIDDPSALTDRFIYFEKNKRESEVD